jgi:hypothetical protein
VFAGPTQEAGKTTMAFQILEYHATPECPAYVMVTKPSDKVTQAEGQRLGYRRVEYWPVERRISEAWDGKPSGYLIWPRYGDIDADADKAYAVLSAAFRDRYKAAAKGEAGIMVVDDTVTKSKLLHLDRYMVTHIAMSGAMKLGGWYFVQKPTDSGQASVWAMENAHHKLISRGGQRRTRQTYDEIGGLEKGMVAGAIGDLEQYQFLYINSRGEACIVDSQ